MGAAFGHHMCDNPLPTCCTPNEAAPTTPRLPHHPTGIAPPRATPQGDSAPSATAQPRGAARCKYATHLRCLHAEHLLRRAAAGPAGVHQALQRGRHAELVAVPCCAHQALSTAHTSHGTQHTRQQGDRKGNLSRAVHAKRIRYLSPLMRHRMRLVGRMLPSPFPASSPPPPPPQPHTHGAHHPPLPGAPNSPARLASAPSRLGPRP